MLSTNYTFKKTAYCPVVSMNPDDDFEFELDEEDEQDDDEIERPKKKKSRQPPSKTHRTAKKAVETKKKKKTPTTETGKKVGNVTKKNIGPGKKVEKTAKRNPIPDGVKRRLAMNMRDITRLRKEIEEYRDEKETIEHELEMLEDEIDSLRSEKENIENDINKQIALANAYEKKLNRNQKDFDNFKKRTQNEVDKKAKLGSKKIYLGIIDVLDNFDRALTESRKTRHSPELDQILSGVESIRKGLVRVLHDNGVDVINPEMEAFDPHFHEAIEIRNDNSVMENTVLEVESKGYIMGDIILRPAKVYVSKGGEPRPRKPKKAEKERASDDEIDEEEMNVDEMEDMEELDEEMEEVEELESY